MRVIVAGRPNPPVPDDVPDWHPLRDPGIVRVLAESPHARDVKRLGQQELQGLLLGGAAGRDVLGLLAAARGGLSGADLSDLAGVPLWEVEKIAHTVAGRTFARRPGRWAPDSGPEVYLLGHEELQAAATRYLADQLPAYRERLHAWAGGYRARGWPPGTPEYLLAGYFQLLAMLGDLRRMAGCALDRVRHDRMLIVTGGDAAALAEVRAALDLTAAQDAPDLGTALALACRRDQLADRNAGTPAKLPAVWAALGQVTRAEALAASITDPHERAEALVRVTEALAAAGLHQQAAAAAAQAEAAAAQAGATPVQTRPGVPYTSGEDQQEKALAWVAGALAAAGQHQQAETVARSITDEDQQAKALAWVAGALALAGQHQQAEAVARSITGEDQDTLALDRATGMLVKSGRYRQAEALAASIADPHGRAEVLMRVAGALARAGRHRQAEAVAGQAEAVARSITDEDSQAQVLALVSVMLVWAGFYERAEAVARSIIKPGWRATALADVAQELARAERHQQAEAVARSITEPGQRATALGVVAQELARAGRHQQAEEVAGQAETAAGQAETAAVIAGPEDRVHGLAAGAGPGGDRGGAGHGWVAPAGRRGRRAGRDRRRRHR
jgi:hypothetical protein